MDSHGLISGRFRLGELLGTGGTASVFDAVDTRDGRRVAMKILHPHLSSSADAQAAFLAEAATAGALVHPNVVGVIASGVHDDGDGNSLWMALELAAGITLGEYVGLHGPLPLSDALTVAEGLLLGLEAAHSYGLVHRDISPANVMIDVAASGVRLPDQSAPGLLEVSGVRLLDFGLADVIGSVALASTDRRMVVGSAHYLSPEQARGLPVDERGDLYQVAGVLYFALTGQPPFPRETTAAVLQAHVHAPPPVPSVLRPASSRALDRIVVKGMLKAPASRYGSAAEMLTAVRDARPSVMASRGRLPDLHSARVIPPLLESERTMVMPAGVQGEKQAVDAEAVTTRLPRAVGGPMSGAESSARAGRTGASRRQATGRADSQGSARVTGVGVLVVLGFIAAMVWAGAVLGATPDTPTAPLASAEPSSAGPSPEPSAAAPSAASTVVVPELGTLSLREATAALLAAGLVVGELAVQDSAVSGDTVLGMSVPAGTALAPGSAVGLAIASGSNVVPATAGLAQGEAAAALQAAGFAVVFSSVDAPGIAENVAVTSQPATGVVVRLGTTVTVLTAGAAVTVPTVAPTPTSAPTPPTPPTTTPTSPPIPTAPAAPTIG